MGAIGKAIYFERTLHGARNVWRMTVDPVTLQPSKVERLTLSPGLDAAFSISPDGSRLAFTSEHRQIRGWVFPFDARRGRVIAVGKPVTSAGSDAWALDLSRDGKKLPIWGNRDGRMEIWKASVPNGQEEPLVAGDSYLRDHPSWSPDGRRAAYLRRQPSSGKHQIVVWSDENRNEYPVERETSNLAFVFDWSPDGKSLLVSQDNDRTHRWEIWQVSVDTSFSGEYSTRKIAADSNYDLWQSHFSPDGGWIAFNAVRDLNSTIYAMPAVGGSWIRITDSKQWDDKPRWSPDGKTIYYLSQSKGFFNLWGIHFDPVNGRPQGKPFQITSFESPNPIVSSAVSEVEISLTEGRLVLPMTQTPGNIWILDNVDR